MTRSRPILLPLIAVLTGSFLLACGEDNKTWGEGNDGVPDIIEEDADLDTFWVARLGVGELNQVTGQDPGHTTLVQAHFSDFSYYRVGLADRIEFTEACTIITSRQVVVQYCQPEDPCTTDTDCPADHVCMDERCMAQPILCEGEGDCTGQQECHLGWGLCVCSGNADCDPGYACLESRSLGLDVDQVTFSGLAGGDLVLVPDENGRIPTKVLGGRAFEGAEVSIDVASAEGDRDFPAFNLSLPAPAAPVLVSLGGVSDPDLSSGPSVEITEMREDSFIVEWEPGEGDYFEFKLLPGTGSETSFMKLRCITFDDGGLEIPVAAIHHMSLDTATNFQVKVERHNFDLHSDKDGDVVNGAALIDVNSALEGTVLR